MKEAVQALKSQDLWRHHYLVQSVRPRRLSAQAASSSRMTGSIVDCQLAQGSRLRRQQKVQLQLPCAVEYCPSQAGLRSPSWPWRLVQTPCLPWLLLQQQSRPTLSDETVAHQLQRRWLQQRALWCPVLAAWCCSRRPTSERCRLQGLPEKAVRPQHSCHPQPMLQSQLLWRFHQRPHLHLDQSHSCLHSRRWLSRLAVG